jgi:hypothetical protein
VATVAITNSGARVWHLDVLVARSRMQTDEGELTPRAHEWIAGVQGLFRGAPAAPEAPPPTGALAFKTA